MNLDRKIPPPIAAIILASAMYWLSEFGSNQIFPTSIKNVLLSTFLGLGLIFDGYSVFLFLKSKTTINPLNGGNVNQLVTAGLYKTTRNPMYLGLTFFLLAFGFHLNTGLPLALVIVFIWYITIFQIIPEERELDLIFGVEYKKYSKNVRRWL